MKKFLDIIAFIILGSIAGFLLGILFYVMVKVPPVGIVLAAVGVVAWSFHRAMMAFDSNIFGEDEYE